MVAYIFEGVDLAGKTTLAKYASETFKIQIIKRVKVTQKMFKKYVDFKGLIENECILNNIDFKNRDCILDRFCISDIIYPKVYKRKVDTSHPTQAFNTLRNYELFYIHSDWEELKRRWHERGDEHISLKKLRELYEAYEKFMFREIVIKKNKHVQVIENHDLNLAKFYVFLKINELKNGLSNKRSKNKRKS